MATLVIPLACRAEAPSQTRSDARLQALVTKLNPIDVALGEPQPGEWRAGHREPRQTFQQYTRSRPSLPRGRRTKIYIQPLGEFTDRQREVIAVSAEYLQLYFARPTVVRPDLSLDVIPDSARRKHPSWGVDQVLSGYVLQRVLKPRLPRDAAALIAFTATDLWPGEGWNFVFGQASLRDRVGVWSIARNGDPDTDDESFRRCLRRTLKTASHETGHMFSLPHCVLARCNMCGSNSLPESDRQPLHLCSHCTAKVCWASRCDPLQRLKDLDAFLVKHKLEEERPHYRRAIRLLEQD